MRQLTAPLATAPIPGEAEKRRGLRKMKIVALAFLLGATAIFLAMSFWQSAGAPAWAGYVKAAAEAGMIGALADWFAVTALFRHPLGIRIPHTAIIPSRKDALGDSLGEFVGTNFLSEQVVRERLRRVGVAKRFGNTIAVVYRHYAHLLDQEADTRADTFLQGALRTENPRDGTTKAAS